MLHLKQTVALFRPTESCVPLEQQSRKGRGPEPDHVWGSALLFRRCVLVLLLLLTAVLLPGASLLARAQDDVAEGPLNPPKVRKPAVLTDEAVMRMTEAGLDQALILQTVRTQPGEYQTGPDDLIALKNAGVSSAVIAAMVAHGSGLAEHAAERPVTVVPLAPDVDENGVYYKDHDGKWVLVWPELVHYQSGGWIKSTVTHGIVKKDRNGEVAGGQSPLVLRPGEELMIVAPPQADPVEYQLLRFRLHSNSREFRAETGGVFTTQDTTQRDQVAIQPKRIAPRIFKFQIPADIGGGEYGVLPPGSASVPGIGFAGKIYTFAITADR